MKNWKKPIAAVLAGICCVVGMPQVQLVLPALQAAAAETADTGTVGTLTYTLESDRAVITQCDENAEEVVIPSEIEGKPVLEIGEGAFQFCEKLTSVEIPDTVQTIGKNAFWSCHKLQDDAAEKSGFRWRQLLSFLRLAGKAGYPRNTAKSWIGCVL
ncbi:MAG: leucine-rich repeat protein [Ruminococcus sp.]